MSAVALDHRHALFAARHHERAEITPPHQVRGLRHQLAIVRPTADRMRELRDVRLDDVGAAEYASNGLNFGSTTTRLPCSCAMSM